MIGKSKMRVLLVNHSPQRTGVAMYVSNLYQQLRKMENISVNIADISDKTGLGFVSSQTHKVKRFVEITSGLLRLPRGFDVYHATSQFISVSRALVKPAVITIHDAAVFLPYEDSVTNFLFKMSFKFAKQAEMVICPSQFTRKETVNVLGISPSRIRVIPLGINHEIFSPRKKAECRKRFNLEENQKLILSVSTTLKHKNLPTLLRAFQLIKKREPKAKLIRVGAPNPATAELERLASKLGIDDSILYMKLSNEELAFLYGAADVFVHTSTYEGFGVPIAEAMGCGLPVVASNAASIPEIVGDAAIMVSPMNAEAFATKALEVLENEQLAAELSEKALARSQLFSWAKCAEETLDLYHRVAS